MSDDAFGIAPWQAATGLSVLVALIYGRKVLPLLSLAPYMVAIVRSVDPWLATLDAAVMGGGYAGGAL